MRVGIAFTTQLWQANATVRQGLVTQVALEKASPCGALRSATRHCRNSAPPDAIPPPQLPLIVKLPLASACRGMTNSAVGRTLPAANRAHCKSTPPTSHTLAPAGAPVNCTA